MVGGEVIGCEFVVVVLLSWQPKNPGVWHSVDAGADLLSDEVVGSLHPNHPGVSHVELLVVEVLVDVAWGGVLLILLVVVVSSLHPNQPGVLQVEVEVVVVVELVLVVAPDVVVVSSKHPHQPGVLHVEVRVLVFV